MFVLRSVYTCMEQKKPLADGNLFLRFGRGGLLPASSFPWQLGCLSLCEGWLGLSTVEKDAQYIRYTCCKDQNC